MFEVGGELFFEKESNTGIDIWRTNGTVAGTSKFIDTPTTPYQYVAVHNRLYYLTQGTVNSDLWRSDSATGTTTKIGTNKTQSLAGYGNSLIIVADYDNTGYEPWIEKQGGRILILTSKLKSLRSIDWF